MDALNERLTVAEGEIKTIEVQLAAVERKLDEPGADISYLREKERQLREEKRQLREKERQLREEKRLILEKERLILERQSPGK
jgi:septal ring factor EnvC (AmiA/AmiB activator)